MLTKRGNEKCGRRKDNKAITTLGAKGGKSTKGSQRGGEHTVVKRNAIRVGKRKKSGEKKKVHRKGAKEKQDSSKERNEPRKNQPEGRSFCH